MTTETGRLATGWRAHSRSANTSKKLRKISDGAERLYWRMHRASDPYGTLDADAESLGMTCTPNIPGWDDQKLADALAELVAAELVIVWADGEAEWAHLVGFDTHQPAYFIQKRGTRKT